ncbi:MAG: 2-hydroxyacyl-CoA dehydratase family protein, partial [Actinomycetia bacterium]|nr:2-hydroxyacyl-CoA dehydratase family protein [Actinomycetes bacterium]
MGVVKEKIRTNIQRNLNQKYLKRLLGIIATKPILYAYGSTSSSISNKYLNIFSIRSIRDTYNGGKPVGFGSLFLPFELFHATGISPFLPEIIGGFTGGLGIADQTLKKASSSWYSQDLCTFHRSASGAVEMDLFPDPSFIICTNLACDAARKSFYPYAAAYGIAENYCLIDVPYNNHPLSIEYLAGQIKRLAK